MALARMRYSSREFVGEMPYGLEFSSSTISSAFFGGLLGDISFSFKDSFKLLYSSWAARMFYAAAG